MHSRSSALGLSVLIVLLLAGQWTPTVIAAPPKSKAAKKVKSDDAKPGGKIDLLTADPAKIDLSKIDPAKLDLTKEKVKKIDLDKWDLSKIDTSKVPDPLAAKWIQKVLKAKRELDKTLSNYRPGELEKLQEANVKKWLQRPAPFDAPKLTRDHRHPLGQIEQAARAIDLVVLEKLGASNHGFNAYSSDEQFVRRIYLDIAGRIPTLDEAQAFFADKRTTKRRELIDQLLLSQDYPSQMFNWAADMLRVRELKGNQGDNSAYQAWLIEQFAANRPWDKTVYDLLTAEGDLVTNPAVGWLVRDGGMPLDSLSNTLTTFMGANIACAQCHDHPNGTFTQRQFYELAAFFGSTDVPGKNVRGAPKILKDRYHSVTSAPKKFLSYPDDYQYSDVKPGSRVTPAFAMLKGLAPRSVGTESQPLGRQDFAAWMTSAKNEQFAATIANRLWGKAFGRPVMEPVTEMDNLDDPGGHHPRLIHAIAALMQDLEFDLMAFQRVIYNTRAYQSEASVSPDDGEAYLFSGPVLRRMTAEQTWDSFLTLIEGEGVNDVRRDRRSLAWSQDVFKEGALDAMAAAEKGRKIEFQRLISKAERLSGELLKELRSKEGGNGKKRKGQENGTTERGSLARASERPQPEEDRHFLRQFGQSPRELMDAASREGGIPQVLMLMNGDEHEMLAKPDSRVIRMAKNARTEAEQIDIMYLSFLSRRPTDAERNIIRREQIDLSKLTWMLMNSREFMFVQ